MAAVIFLRPWWRWPDSNRCPNTFSKSFLHVYPGINCRRYTGDGRTNI